MATIEVEYINPSAVSVQTDIVAASSVTVESEVVHPVVGYDFQFLENIKEEMLLATDAAEQATAVVLESSEAIKQTEVSRVSAENTRNRAETERIASEKQREQGYAQMEAKIAAKQDKLEILQSVGTSPTAIMSQKGVTDSFNSSIARNALGVFSLAKKIIGAPTAVHRLDANRYVVWHNNIWLTITDLDFNAIKTARIGSYNWAYSWDNSSEQLFVHNGLIYMSSTYGAPEIFKYCVVDFDLNVLLGPTSQVMEVDGRIVDSPTCPNYYTSFGTITVNAYSADRKNIVYMTNSNSLYYFDPSNGYMLRRKDTLLWLGVEHPLVDESGNPAIVACSLFAGIFSIILKNNENNGLSLLMVYRGSEGKRDNIQTVSGGHIEYAGIGGSLMCVLGSFNNYVFSYKGVTYLFSISEAISSFIRCNALNVGSVVSRLSLVAYLFEKTHAGKALISNGLMYRFGSTTPFTPPFIVGMDEHTTYDPIDKKVITACREYQSQNTNKIVMM